MVEDEIDKLVIEVADARTVVRCPACGFRTTRVHETRRVMVRDIPMGRPTTLVWLQRRFECTNCGERHTEDHPEIEGKVTRRLARQLVRDSKYLTIRELARRHRLSWHLVMGIVREWATAVAAHRRSSPCRVLLVDETSLRRRHRYVTVLLNGESGEVLAMVRHRDAAALSSFFAAQGHRWCRLVKVVVTDGSESYRAAIRAHVGGATHVVDRFHVVRWFAAGLVEVRRRIQRREPRGHVSPVFDPEVFRNRFLALRRADRLSDAERLRWRRSSPPTPSWPGPGPCSRSCTASTSPTTRTRPWRPSTGSPRLYVDDPLPEFYKVVDTLLKWAPEIFAFHRAGRISNGRLEGTNNKLGVLKRMAFGFVNASNFEARGLLLCSPRPALP